MTSVQRAQRANVDARRPRRRIAAGALRTALSVCPHCRVAFFAPGWIGGAVPWLARARGAPVTRWWWLQVAWALAVAAPVARAADQAESSDERVVEAQAAAALAAGDKATARALLARRLELLEVASYLDWRDDLTEALLLEGLGEHDAAAALYRKGFQDDLLRTLQVLRIVSQHPAREALAAEGRALAVAAAETVRAGGAAVLYITSKGEPRPLVPKTTAEILAAAAEGETVQYCFVELLDFTGLTEVPEKIHLDRCLIGAIRAPGVAFDKLLIGKSIVLGDAELGKTFQGEVNRSKTNPPSTFHDLYVRDTIFFGRANFWAITVSGERAYFPLVVFEGPADFRGADLEAVTDFRFASFGADANFKHAKLSDIVFFGNTRFRAPTVFVGLDSARTVYFNAARFEDEVTFTGCEWRHDATFEDAVFSGPASLADLRIDGALNLSRARFQDDAVITRLRASDLDALGAIFAGRAMFTDGTILRRSRFSLDTVTRDAAAAGTLDLLSSYRWYQGDEDADEPLVTGSSYGVTGPDDLTARFLGDASFANTVFGGYTVFEAVAFGSEGTPSTASFYNAQLLGETHFERTAWWSVADFTTIFGSEVAFNGATIHRSLILDDANVQGRVNLAEVVFADHADVSFNDAEISTLEVDPDQLLTDEPGHRLFYERCALGRVDRSDRRVAQLEHDGPLDDAALREACYDATLGEFTTLRGAFEDAALPDAADEAYWWLRHHEARRAFWTGGVVEKLQVGLISITLFELMFGWGVRLGNLSITALGVIAVWAVLFRLLCAEAQLGWFGKERKVNELSPAQLLYVSLCCFTLTDYGIDMEADEPWLRVLIASENVSGVIVMTFFVGAYTRLILA
jgi:uncharacterized protein YjbI with pentapeptide repeats